MVFEGQDKVLSLDTDDPEMIKLALNKVEETYRKYAEEEKKHV